jgi:hypothetical protein
LRFIGIEWPAVGEGENLEKGWKRSERRRKILDESIEAVLMSVESYQI